LKARNNAAKRTTGLPFGRSTLNEGHLLAEGLRRFQAVVRTFHPIEKRSS